LERDISELLTRPVGRPGNKLVVWYKGFLYQAASWKDGGSVYTESDREFQNGNSGTSDLTARHAVLYNPRSEHIGGE
jgi:hypothetical protein